MRADVPEVQVRREAAGDRGRGVVALVVAGQTVVETTSDGCTRSRTGVKCTTYGWCLQITNTVQCECMGGECVNPCGMYECRNL